MGDLNFKELGNVYIIPVDDKKPIKMVMENSKYTYDLNEDDFTITITYHPTKEEILEWLKEVFK